MANAAVGLWKVKYLDAALVFPVEEITKENLVNSFGLDMECRISLMIDDTIIIYHTGDGSFPELEWRVGGECSRSADRNSSKATLPPPLLNKKLHLWLSGWKTTKQQAR